MRTHYGTGLLSTRAAYRLIGPVGTLGTHGRCGRRYGFPTFEQRRKELFHFGKVPVTLDENTLDFDLKKQATEAAKGQGCSGGWSSRSATKVAHRVRAGARLTRIGGGVVAMGRERIAWRADREFARDGCGCFARIPVIRPARSAPPNGPFACTLQFSDLSSRIRIG